MDNTNSTNMSNGIMDSKQMTQFLQTVVDARVTSAIDTFRNQSRKVFYGQIINVTDDGNYADILFQYGADQVRKHVVNKTNTVLQIGDEVQICVPNGNLTNMYIEANQNPIVIFDAAKIKGIFTVGGIDDMNGTIILKTWNNQTGLSLHDESIDWYDWINSQLLVGEMNSARLNDSNGNPTGTPVLSISSVSGNYFDIASRTVNNLESVPIFRLDNKVSDSNKYKLNLFPHFFNIQPRNDDNSSSNKGINIDKDNFNIYQDVNMQGWNITGVGNVSCQTLNIAGSKSCVQQTKNFGKVKFYSYELAENWLGDLGFGDIRDGQCVIYIDDIIQEGLNLNCEYMVQLMPIGQCNIWVEEEHPNYFIVKADKDVHFGWELKGKRRGFEYKRLENPKNIDDSLIPTQSRDYITEEINKHKGNSSNVLNYLFKDTIIDKNYFNNILNKKGDR